MSKMYVERLNKNELIEYTEQIICNNGERLNKDEFTRQNICDKSGRVDYVVVDYVTYNESEEEVEQSAIIKDFDLKKGHLTFFIDIFGNNYIESLKNYLKDELKKADDESFLLEQKQFKKVVKFCNDYYDAKQRIENNKRVHQTQLSQFF